MVDLLGNGFWKFLGIRPPISDNHHLILPFSLRSTFFEDFIWRFLFCIFGCSEMISQKQSTPGLTPGTPENRREVWISWFPLQVLMWHKVLAQSPWRALPGRWRKLRHELPREWGRRDWVYVFFFFASFFFEKSMWSLGKQNGPFCIQ